MVIWRNTWRSPPFSFYGLSPSRCVRRSSTYSSIAAILHPKNGRSTPTIGDTIQVNGFVRTVRKQKNVAFAAIEDGSTLEALQAVLTPDQAQSLSTGTSVSLRGTWESAPKGKEQVTELHAQHVNILGQTDPAAYPIQKKYHTPDFLRTIPHLRVRTPYHALLLRLRSHVIASATDYFVHQDYIQTHPPIITSSDCEGAGEVFTVSTDDRPQHQVPEQSRGVPSTSEHFFQVPKFLTVSSQLHLEALAHAVGKVWSLSPTFRAEKSDTSRHLSEFYMLEAETAFVDELEPVMDLVEGLLRDITRRLLASRISTELIDACSRDQASSMDRSDAAQVLEERWRGLMRYPWPRITYEQAIKQLQEAADSGRISFTHTPSVAEGLHTEHERYLAESIGCGGPLFVTDYPQNMKAFYMAPSKPGAATPERLPTAACFDLLVPEICELAGGSVRESRLSELLAAMERHGLARPDTVRDSIVQDTDTTASVIQGGRATVSSNDGSRLDWYTDLRRFGSVPHGGFGIGFDRLLAYLSGVSNVRDVVSFPRWFGRCDC